MTARRTQGCVLLALLVASLAGPPLAIGSESPDEHYYPAWAATAPYNRPLLVLDTDGAFGRLSLKPKTLTLRDIALVHGHLCDGMVSAWVQLGVALRALFPDGVVDRTDLRVVSKNGPCWADTAGWTTGARVNHATLVLDNAVGSGFIVQRVSTGHTVKVSLKPGVAPKGFVALEDAIRAQTAAGKAASPADIDRVGALADAFSRQLLTTPPDRIVQIETLTDYQFPTASPNLVGPRSDIIHRNVPRTTAPAGGGR